ncbi:zinc-binding alcohol dehydrogenase family protein [Gayadomonas joobiniege]|uniref:zinc-binding alcohol dehydrogenase family protein n=1 Tax=Gayadomonas joobiniege TaxID=1234606 RepID=UPI00036CDDB0|nr:zinc-binding alcohol dehydrogenase family protein [Gayadomonas joobiniege]
MKSIVCVKPGQMEAQEKPIPKAAAGEVVVKIRAVGVCGTDIHAYAGNQPYFEYPRVLGHELAGTIIETGENCGLSVGQNVYVIPYLSCGQCIACKQGKTNACQNIQVIGVHADGGMCEYLNVPESAVVAADNLAFEQMALIECLAIGAHAVRRADIKKGEKVLVMGSGPIGMGVIQFAQEKGADVIVSDLNEDRLAFCQKEFNTFGTIKAGPQMRDELAKLTDNNFAEVIFDCSGSVHAMQSAFTNLAHGGRIVFVSLVKGEISFNDPEFHKRETTLMGSRNATKEDFEHVVDCMTRGVVKSNAMITHRTSFDKLVEVFPDWVKPESGMLKGLIEFDS